MTGTFIFVLDRGFVVVGKAELDPDLAFTWKLSRACTIRHWGTTEGLGQLVQGPLPNTKLDPVVEERIPFRAVLRILTVEAEAWDPVLSGEMHPRTPA